MNFQTQEVWEKVSFDKIFTKKNLKPGLRSFRGCSPNKHSSHLKCTGSRDDAKKLVDMRSVHSDAALVLEGSNMAGSFLAQAL